METETARLPGKGQFQLSSAFEFQTSANGQEFAAPLALEFGVLDRLELLIEPVAFTSIQPKGGSAANGIGDTEVTLTYLLFDEKPILPAFAVAGEVKIPTATNLQIGTKEFDYRIYGVASKRVGDFDFHLNVGYTFVGQPTGVKTRNPVDVEFAIEWFINEKFDLYGELNYSASSSKSSKSKDNPTATAPRHGRASETADAGGGATVAAELGGEEIIGTLGVRYHMTPTIDLFTSFSYDNNDAKLIRTGISWRFWSPFTDAILQHSYYRGLR